MKETIQNLLAGIGYDLYRRDARFHSELCATRFAEKHGLRTIVDVGANVGQYGKSLREWGYKGRIVSFEPLTSAHGILSRTAAGDDTWIVAPRCAIGSERSTGTDQYIGK